jgi:MbtH protein
MSNTDRKAFGIVCNEEQQFSIWPAHLAPPLGYRFAGPTGTRAEMQALVEQQFVATAPSMHIAQDQRLRDTNWVVSDFAASDFAASGFAD